MTRYGSVAILLLSTFASVVASTDEQQSCGVNGCAAAEDVPSLLVTSRSSHRAGEVKEEESAEERIAALTAQVTSLKAQLAVCTEKSEPSAVDVIKKLVPWDELSKEQSEELDQIFVDNPHMPAEMLQKIGKVMVEGCPNDDEPHPNDDEPEWMARADADGIDVTKSDLDEAHMEKLAEEEAVLKVEKLAMTLKHEGVGDAAEESKLENDLIDGKVGTETLKEVEDIIDSIPDAKEGESVDMYLKLGVGITDEDFDNIQGLELGISNIQDPVQLGEDVAHEHESQLIQEEGDNLTARALLSNRKPAGLLKKSGSAANATGDGGRRWPEENGKVTIRFCRYDGITDQAWDKFKDAKKSISGHCSKFNFEEVDRDNDCKLKVKGDEGGCWAYVGWQGWGNMINLADGNWFEDTFTGTCASKGIAEHELLHALGMFHEQSRDDRKVDVFESNIASGKGHNFDKDAAAHTGVGYDMGSLMHYGCKAFSKNGFSDTIRQSRRRRRWNWGRSDCWEMGQRSGLASSDIQQLKDMYEC